MHAIKILAIALFTIGSATVTADTEVIARRYELNIPAGDLATALNQLSKQTGIDLVYRPEQLRGMLTSGVRGDLTARDAIAKLLDGTPLTLSTDATGAMLIAMPLKQRTSNESMQAAQSDAKHLADGDRSRQDGVIGEANEIQSEESKPKLEEVLVTGTNITGVGPVGSALIIHDRAEIERSGAGTTPQFLRQLPENFANVDETGQSSSGTSVVAADFAAGTSVNLHGIGVGSTLTLLDGRRLAPTGFQGAVTDVSVIPLAAVERVEVLTDGASAIYGSDAVAGVVNFVLRKHYDGAEFTARYADSTDGGGLEKGASGILGRAWNSEEVMASYDYYHQDPITAGQRDFIILPANQAALDVIPRQLRNSAFLSFRQDLRDGAAAYGNALYSKRQFGLFQPSAFGTSIGEGSAASASGLLGAKFRLGSRWSGDISAAAAKFDADIVSVTTLTTGSAVTTASSGSSRISTGNVLLDGELFHMTGGLAKLALGAQERRETYTDATANRVRLNAGRGVEIDRAVGSAFAELFVPFVGMTNRFLLVDRLEASLAARVDHYNDFGSTANPKLGMLWSPIERLIVRATFGTSFRAPTLPQSSGAGTAYTVLRRVADPLSATGTTNVVSLSANGREDLGPEKAKSFTAGINWSAWFAPALSVSLNYFNIDYRDRITNPPVSGGITQILNQRAVLAPYITDHPDLAAVQAIYADPNFRNSNPPVTVTDIGAIFDGRPTNVAESRTAGVDGSIRYKNALSVGDLGMIASVSHLLRSDFRTAPDLPATHLLDTLFNPIDWRIRASVDWGYRGITLGTACNYADQYLNTAVTPATRISSWTTVDASVGYRFESTASGPLAGGRIMLAVNNLMDRPPPAVLGIPNTFGYDGANANPRGRFVSLLLGKSW